jgi:outer membrane protein OmpA-like peptidoglycan-associated protein
MPSVSAARCASRSSDDASPKPVTALKAFAAKRGAASIAVTGFGEASSDDLEAQRAALTLGMARARAVAAVLTGAGVPDQSLRLEAQAIGRGASARLVN